MVLDWGNTLTLLSLCCSMGQFPFGLAEDHCCVLHLLRVCNPSTVTLAMTPAGCCICDEQLLLSDMPWQIHRSGEEAGLDVVHLDMGNDVSFYFIPLCVKLAGLMPAFPSPRKAATSLPPSSAFTCCSGLASTLSLQVSSCGECLGPV